MVLQFINLHDFYVFPSRVIPYPKGLIKWAKSRSTYDRDDIPQVTLSSSSGFDWSMLEKGEDSLLFHSGARTDLSDEPGADEPESDKPGIPVFSIAKKVVALGTFSIYFEHSVSGRKTALIKFSCRMDKIVEDIRRQNLELAEDLIRNS